MSVIVSGARTPIAKFRGALSQMRAVDLGGIAIRAALQRSGIAGDSVDYTIMGHVLQAGAGQITAPQAALAAAIPQEAAALTGNKVAQSGMSARATGDGGAPFGDGAAVVGAG